MICLVASPGTSVHLWEFTQCHSPEGSHPEVSDRTEYTQKMLCTERSLSCNTAVMSSVDEHYEQTFREVANATREDGQSCLLKLDVLIMKNKNGLILLVQG